MVCYSNGWRDADGIAQWSNGNESVMSVPRDTNSAIHNFSADMRLKLK